MKPLVWTSGLLSLVAAGAGAFIWSGVYNIAADDPHWPVTERVLEMARERSIEARVSASAVPDLDDASLIRAGAGNYDAMCVDCHLQPGEDRTELSTGLNPAPPNLGRERIDDPAEAFWVIKHGIKMSGMPAWGRSMDDESIWGMVAFLQQLPDMSEVRYRELVESSEGHTHGPAESQADDHDGAAADAQDEQAATHVHADGSADEHKN